VERPSEMAGERVKKVEKPSEMAVKKVKKPSEMAVEKVKKVERV
jgi:hypothetical protein